MPAFRNLSAAYQVWARESRILVKKLVGEKGGGVPGRGIVPYPFGHHRHEALIRYGVEVTFQIRISAIFPFPSEVIYTKDTLGTDRPATSVSWNEAARFVNWLNVSSGHSAACKFTLQPGDTGFDANADIELWTSGDPGYNPGNLYRVF